MSTTLYINSVAVSAHFGGEPATFAISRSPIAGSVNTDEMFKSFYTTGMEECNETINTPIEVDGEIQNETVYAVKATIWNNWWAFLKVFSSESAASEWLEEMKRKRDNASDEDAGYDELCHLIPFQDLQDEACYSENWGLDVVAVNLGATGWSEWSDD